MITMVGFLRATALSGAATGVFLLVYALAKAPSGEAVRLGLRGLKRERALEQNALWAQVEPLVRWSGRRLRGWISESTARSLETRLVLAGDFLGLVPEEFVALSALSTVACAALGYVFGQVAGLGSLATTAGFGYGVVSVSLSVSGAKAERFKSISRRLPHALDLVSLAMGAGLDFPASIRQVIEKAGNASDPLVEEFTLILQSLRLGRSRRQALEEFARRVPCDAVIEFVGSVVQAELRGTPVVNVLQIQADVSRQQRSVRAEETASKAGVKMILPLTMVFLCVMMLVIAPIVMKLQNTM